MSKVIVIGGGIIGLASAYYLRKKGCDVVVLEKGEPGAACSRGNMGWICPTLSEPVPAPGLVKTTLKWMMRSDSPLYIKPTIVPSLFPWLYQFWRNCNEATFEKGYDAGLMLSRETFNLFDELERDKQVEFEMHRKGLLFVFLKENLVEEKFNELQRAAKIGLPLPEIKTRSEVLEMEPALSDSIAGGLFLPAERHVRPESLSKGLYKWLVENGVEVVTNCEVGDFIHQEGKIIRVRTNHDVFEGDQYLLTTGVWTKQVLKFLDLNIPMTAGKGYSITISNPSSTINRPLYLGDSKVALSPFNDAIRIGGTMELSGINTNMNTQRVNSLENGVSKYLRSSINGSKKVWVGMRPMTPDGLPILGRVPTFNNLYVASGHAMSGVSMSLATGVTMANFIYDSQSPVDLTPFSPERFSLTAANRT
ncbi:NAD(P)/FAD-dependent oxidoreductase [Neobacillus citreus]|uniref:FAD-dependent oxidoreductase n=1 Tax=Neobacillus citreus TaxID=2833578 RepID=A0A942TB76_9BACI|nr:FAD-dependent oxidoreductase [Neobacillus citreus]MCH6266971.1 FAD-dependent oxidoreductase [Neobacillus citreus]